MPNGTAVPVQHPPTGGQAGSMFATQGISANMAAGGGLSNAAARALAAAAVAALFGVSF
ncbi:hypothetical protein [Streptomyces sp. NPDC058751]|uniref:hypothetical protein n=1 Tax=Streptomyces sp. NPDC058751 TaxID=3346623 RepID=UPI0036803173